MKLNEQITIYQDGKLGRGVDATVVGIRSGAVCVTFTRFACDDDVLTVWCRRRHKKGKYEAIGWNYWILPLVKELV